MKIKLYWYEFKYIWYHYEIWNVINKGAGRMITSTPERSEGFDCVIRPAPSGAERTTQHPRSPVIIPQVIIPW